MPGCAERIRTRHSIPSSGGIARSTTATSASTLSRSASSAAPLSASPTTVMSSSPSRTVLTASRISIWSSATTTRSFFIRRRTSRCQTRARADCCVQLRVRPSPGGGIGARARLHAVLQRLRLGERLELLERVVLDLADPLARDAEGAAHLLERARLLAREAEAQLDHTPLALRERGQRLLDVRPPQRQRGRVGGRRRVHRLCEVPELAIPRLADRLLEADRMLRHAQDLAHLVGRHLQLGRDL